MLAWVSGTAPNAAMTTMIVPAAIAVFAKFTTTGLPPRVRERPTIGGGSRGGNPRQIAAKDTAAATAATIMLMIHGRKKFR